MTNSLKTSTELNQKFKRKWITALRSGNYKQGTGLLKSVGVQEYCCLGVACDLVGLPRSVFANKAMPCDLSKTSQAKLPPFFRGESDDVDHLRVLSDMNDSGDTFEEIADYIEENL